ncbi:phosphoribosyltransferase [Halovivax limisalsi]|uniref:phosphoribosyltransferase n=1 Tax=Halovivax limisalsi TaxID=1453760 RepID=UPI001FFDC707|nr:phosphoribosyltransferase family protein [Halovivax limisalsi]
MFDDRADAGRRLAAELDRRDVEADVVLGIPRGALPVARPVADRLDADLDVIVASKLGAPGNPELAIGAAGSDGAVWRNDALIEQLDVSEAYFEREREREADAARTKLERYRGTTDLPALEGRHVVVVDDGVATGATARACLRQVRERDPASVTLAVPVSSPRAADELADEADAVVALETPQSFRAVGQFYRRFPQVSDDEAMDYLE